MQMHPFRLHLIATFFACSLLIRGYAQQTSNPIAVPEGTKLILHAFARGVQTYVCVLDPKDSTQFIWSLFEPKANLYSKDNYRQQIGKHYYSPEHQPVWESTDGSVITGARVQQMPSPDTSAIAWLLLKTINATGFGPLRSATYIQRTNTKGGKAPYTGATKEHAGEYVSVPYTAEYWFYGDK